MVKDFPVLPPRMAYFDGVLVEKDFGQRFQTFQRQWVDTGDAGPGSDLNQAKLGIVGPFPQELGIDGYPFGSAQSSAEIVQFTGRFYVKKFSSVRHGG
jgi:hypothetical protein